MTVPECRLPPAAPRASSRHCRPAVPRRRQPRRIVSRWSTASSNVLQVGQRDVDEMPIRGRLEEIPNNLAGGVYHDISRAPPQSRFCLPALEFDLISCLADDASILLLGALVHLSGDRLARGAGTLDHRPGLFASIGYLHRGFFPDSSRILAAAFGCLELNPDRLFAAVERRVHALCYGPAVQKPGPPAQREDDENRHGNYLGRPPQKVLAGEDRANGQEHHANPSLPTIDAASSRTCGRSYD